METVIISSVVELTDEDSTMSDVSFFTEISTEIVWEDHTVVTQLLLTDHHQGSTAILNSSTTTADSNLVVSHAVAVSVVLLIINLMVIFGNILILLAVYCERALRTVTNYFIVNLALADLLLGTLVLPFSGAFEVLQYWPFGDPFCDIWAAVDVLCCTASINSLCCISVDRYIGVTRPLKHRLIMTPRRAVMINVFVWIISFCIAVVPLFGWRPDKTSNLDCPLSNAIGYVFFSVAGSFYIPSTIILVLYIRIYRAVSRETKSHHSKTENRRHSNREENGHAGRVILRIHVGNKLGKMDHGARDVKPGSMGSTKGRNMSQRMATFNREKKVAKTLGIVVGVFIVCWFPFFLLLPLTSVCDKCQPPPIVFKFFFWLGYCNSCINPIIYAMSNLTFRRAFRKILTFWYCRDHRPLIRRKYGSRHSSNVSRLTSTTPVPSPTVKNRRKRFAKEPTTSDSSLVRGEYQRLSRKGSSQLVNGRQGGRILDRGRTYDIGGNKETLDRYGTVKILPTIESESTTENNCLLKDNSKQDDNIDASKHFTPTTSNKSYSSLDNNNTKSNIILYEIQQQPLLRCGSSSTPRGQARSSYSRVRTSDPLDYQSKTDHFTVKLGFKSLTNEELSSGIHDSKETSV